MKICLAGKNQIAVSVLEALIPLVGKDAIIVIPNRDDTGRTTWQPSLRRVAKSRGIQCGSLEDVYQLEDLVFLSVEFDRIIRPALFRSQRLFNIHFSQLPKYRGVYTAVWPVLNGDDTAGVTLHWIDAGIDTGEVIASDQFELKTDATARSVYLGCMQVGTKLVLHHLQELLHGDPRRLSQPSRGASYFPKGSFDFSSSSLSFSATAWQVSCWLRARMFVEFQLPRFQSRPLSTVRITDDKSTKPSGTLVAARETSFVVATKDLDVELAIDSITDAVEAAQQGASSRLAFWLDHGVDVNARGGRGWNPLHAAVYGGHVELVQQLIHRRADPNAANFRGTTPLMYARSCVNREQRPRLVDLLLKAGASRDSCDEDARTVADYAKDEADAEFLQLIST